MPRGRPKREEQKRIPAGMPRQKLKVEGMDPSKKYFFANEGQINELQDAGYDFVRNTDDLTIGQEGKEDEGTIVSRPASRSDDSKLYLMSIPKKYYEENQKVKQDMIKEQETEMFNRGDTETTYMVKGSRKEGH